VMSWRRCSSRAMRRQAWPLWRSATRTDGSPRRSARPWARLPARRSVRQATYRGQRYDHSTLTVSGPKNGVPPSPAEAAKLLAALPDRDRALWVHRDVCRASPWRATDADMARRGP
jgi:hypothetical protein